MTALKEFDRLEATGLWRPTPQDQRREVIVSLGDATLTMSNTNGTALAHWSLGAVQRANPGTLPAIYHPDGDAGETLELPEDEGAMIDGIDRLLRAIDRKRPRPGKLRLILGSAVALTIAAGAVFWLPEALENYTVTVVPSVKRQEIGEALLADIARVAGAPCSAPEAARPLDRLTRRVLPEGGRIAIVPNIALASTHLPGGIVLLDRSVIEDHEDPDVAAGYILSEATLASQNDPLAQVIDHAGLLASLRLLTTGTLPEPALDAYAEHLMAQPETRPDDITLLAAFARAEIRSTPYAYARDPEGKDTRALIDGDPRAGQPSREVLSDADWLRLQSICGG